MARVFQRLEQFYGFRSLYAFKIKFQPRLEPLYLVYPNQTALPRIALALTEAYLPDLRPHHLGALRRG